MRLYKPDKGVIVSISLTALVVVTYLEPWNGSFGPALVVGTQTTRITSPLRADGSMDYMAALNAKYSQDVTPENNAAVLMARAVNLSDMPAAYRTEFYRLLGIAAP